MNRDLALLQQRLAQLAESPEEEAALTELLEQLAQAYNNGGIKGVTQTITRAVAQHKNQADSAIQALQERL